MRRTLAVVALAVLLALSGCSVLGGDGTPTAEPGLSPEDAPPGVSAENESLDNSTALLEAHSAALLDSGFRYEIQTNATVAQQGEVRQVRRQQVMRVGPGAAQYNYTTINPGSRFDVWGNQSVQAAKFQFDDRVQYRSGEPAAPMSLTAQNLFARYLSSGEWTVTNVTERDDGPTLIALTSTTPPTEPGGVPRNATDIRDYEAQVVVDTEGRIYQFEAGGTYTIDGEEGSFRILYVLRSLEDPGVTRPPWLSEAL